MEANSDFGIGSFTRRGLLVDIFSAETWGGDKAWKEQTKSRQDKKETPPSCLECHRDWPIDLASS